MKIAKPSLLLLLLVCFLSLVSSAQDKLFRELSYKQALKKSLTLKKPILLFYEQDDNEQWNEIIPRALSRPDIAQLIEESFIGIKISQESKDRMLVQDIVTPQMPFNLYFLDGEGNLLSHKKSTMPVTMDSIIKYALKTYQNRVVVEEIEKTYFNKGNKNIEDLKKLIQAKTDLGLDTKLLLTELINLLPRDSIQSLPVIRFLMHQSPVYGSNAYQKAVHNPRFLDAWRPMPLEDRVSINRQIIKKSTNIAIANRDMDYAKKVVYFARSTYDNEQGKLYAERSVLMNYYIHTGDTIRYMQVASVFNDDYAANCQPPKDTGIETADTLTADIPERLRQLKIPTAVKVASPNPYALYLNNAANFFYRIDREKKYLQQAANWAAQSVALYPDYMNRHTYALLLYALGREKEAIEMETLAIATAKEKKLSYASKWEPILQKMKEGQDIY